MISCKIKLIPNTNIKYGLYKASSIYNCNLTVYVGLRDDLGAQSSPIYRRVYVSAEAVIRPLESRFRGQKKHTLTQQLSVLILYHVDETRIDETTETATELACFMVSD